MYRKRSFIVLGSLLMASLYYGVGMTISNSMSGLEVKATEGQQMIEGQETEPIICKVEEYTEPTHEASRASRGGYQPPVVEEDVPVVVFSVQGIATSYSPYDNQNGIQAEGLGSVTSTGVAPGPSIFAVDPDLIPYGSHLRLTYPDGSIREGYAGDTGGALRANGDNGIYQIDVFSWTFDEAIQHGLQHVKIEILDEE